MIPTSVLIKLATLGLSEQQAEAVGTMLSEVESVTRAEANAVVEKSREKARARLQRWRDKQPENVSKRFTTSPAVSQRLTRGEDNLPREEIPGKEGRKKEARGARIPDDFQPDIEAAVSEGVPRAEAQRQAGIFVDYWRSKPGKEALKLDWPATWRIWYRRNTGAIPRATAPPAAKGIVGAAQRIMEQANGSEIIFGDHGDAQRLSAEQIDKPGRAAEDVRGGIGRRFAPSNH